MDFPNDPPEKRPDSFATTWVSLRTQIHRYGLMLKRRWWLVILTTAIGLGGAAWSARQIPPSFASSARMMVSGKMNIAEGAIYSEELNNFFGTQTELMKSGEVQTRAYARVRAAKPEFSALRADLSVAQQPRTSIFSLRAVAANGPFAQEFLNACMNEYVATKRAMRSEKSETALSALTDEIISVEKELRKNEELLLKFQEENNLGYLKEEGNSAGVYLTSLNRQYAELKTEYQLLEKLAKSDLDQALDSSTNSHGGDDASADRKILSSLGPMSEYLKARQNLNLLKAEREQLSVYMRPKHPDIMHLDEEISRTERLIVTFRAQSIDQFHSRQDAIRVQMENLAGVIKDWELKAVELSRKLAEYDRLRGNGERIRGVYERLSASLRTLDVTKAVDQDTVSILERASPAVSIQTGLPRMLGNGFFGGLVLGLGLILAMSKIDDRVTSVLDVEGLFTERVLGQVIRQTHSDVLSLMENSAVHQNFLESFRAIRSSLLFLPEKGCPRSILVTSAIPSEGKSTVATHLAIIFAMAGTRTLLVDGDLRRGALHKSFKLENPRGFAEVLKTEANWRDVVQPTAWSKLSLMTRGGRLDLPGERILSPSTDALMRELEEAFEVVIVDSAPVMVAEDTGSLAAKIDSVVVVLRYSKSSIRISQRAIERLVERRAKIGGLILNEINDAMPEYSEYNYGTYGYSEK